MIPTLGVLLRRVWGIILWWLLLLLLLLLQLVKLLMGREPRLWFFGIHVFFATFSAGPVTKTGGLSNTDGRASGNSCSGSCSLWYGRC